MANLEFRSDVSMQDANAPDFVLFNLVPEPLTIPASLPIPTADLVKNIVKGTRAAGSPSLALRVTCRQDVPIERPQILLIFGSNPKKCSLILDRAYVDPVHCHILAQLNSGFDIWIIRDYSTSGTYYKRLKQHEDPQKRGEVEGLADEELIHKDTIAVPGLRYLRIGPYSFNCVPTKDKAERAERDQWFRRHEPVLVSAPQLQKQLKGKAPSLIHGRKIGEGSFGQVFEYMEQRTGLLVAVKKMMSSKRREFRGFVREAQSMEELEHPNVVSRIDYSQAPPEDGKRVLLIVMPLFRCSLWQSLGKLSLDGRLKVMSQVIEGLKYLHGQGYLHRDIKPENIFVASLTPLVVKVGDVGLMSAVDAFGRGAGTKPYKAPEVYFEDRQTPAIDVYALGVTALQMWDKRALEVGCRGLQKWIEEIGDHPPPKPFSRLITQMLGPYPPTLRPTLDTIQKHLLLQEDLPESVQRPQLSLRDTLEMLKARDARPALRDSPVPSPDPIATPVSPLVQQNLLESRTNLRNNDLHRQIGLTNYTTRQPDPLDIVSRERAPAPQNPTITEREVHGPSELQLGRYTRPQGPPNAERRIPRIPPLQPAARSMHGGQPTIPQCPTIGARRLLEPLKLQPAAHDSQRGRYPTPESPIIIEREDPGPSRQQPATQDTMPAPARQEPDQRPLTQAVDFSQYAIEPNNPYPPERVQAEINRRVAEERRKEKELRRKQKQNRLKAPASRHSIRPMPGAYPPSESALSRSDNVSRTSQLSTTASGHNHDSQSPPASTELHISRQAHDISRRTSARRNGGDPGPTRTRVDTHARHHERAHRLERILLQREKLEGLMLTLIRGANGIFNTLPNRVRRLIRG